MANSSIISRLKDKIINEIINDEQFFDAIHPSDIRKEDADLLLGTHLFNYHQNPETLKEVETFLTFQVHIPNPYDRNRKWVASSLEIWIISHQSHMKVNNIPGITANRNDYIAQLLDQKFNGKRNVGGSPVDKNNLHVFGTLDLLSNVEGAFASDYLYRRLIFECKDINDSFCDIDGFEE